MNVSTSATGGEPPSANRIKIFILLLSLLFVFVISCTKKEKGSFTEKKIVANPVIRQQQKNTATTLVKPILRKKKIYLTFDDGPNRGTMNVLNAVKEENIPVSFFIVGKHVFDSPQQQATWQQLKEDSTIELCNHSYTHALNHYTKFYQNPAGVIKDFEESAGKLGFDNNVARMPGRNAWRIDSIDHTDIKESSAAIDSAHKAGFAIMGWDIEWMFDHKTFALTTDTDLLLRRIQNMLDASTTRTPGHLVLLAHDQAFQTQESVAQLHYLIQQLKNNPQYVLELAGNYPGCEKFNK